MRITQSMMLNSMLARLNKNLKNLSSLQSMISTGKEIHRSSDDPIRFNRASRFKEAIAQGERFLRNINDAAAWVDSSTNALENLHTLILNAKEIAQKAANATNNSDVFSSYANQVNGIMEESLTLANSRYLDKNLFGGTQTKSGLPFSVQGDLVIYNGNNENIFRKISESLTVGINVTGQQLLDSGLFESLIELKQALENEDVPAIQNSIEVLSDVSKKLLTLTTNMGSLRNNLDLAEQRLNRANVNLAAFVSGEEDGDMVEAIVKLEAEEIAYRAALQATAEVLKLNILQFLK